MPMIDFRCGFVALVGRPNVGKSTIINRLVGQKISITSRRPQTTRHRILGIKTDAQSQIIFVDTPGMHANQPRAMNRYLNRAAFDSLADVDVAVFVVEGTRWQNDDDWILERLKNLSCPVIAAVNKIDHVDNKELLLPALQALSSRFEFAEIIPVSARKGDQLQQLEAAVLARLPEAPPFYNKDQVTDRSERFLAAELVREKLFRKLGEEIPYGLTVEIESFKQEKRALHIHALIWVEKTSHKPIVIGNKGQRLKEVGREAREDMQVAFDQKVFLQLWVKVKEGWADDERALQSLGYDP
ncbi:GTP-binding protein Era [hydrothermal vent metagenome]|uniref:GTP-binding protein Era n=1 Tax=hydrothermal vent metagenome TaxID=652676 RepID=A0A3B0YDE4_9ZZZZ